MQKKCQKKKKNLALLHMFVNGLLAIHINFEPFMIE